MKPPLIAAVLFTAMSGDARAADIASADSERGARLYASRCIACHSLDANRIGPKHRGVVGRTAGTVDDYDYSAAVKSSGIRWDERTLEQWLANPQALIPGQKMNFRIALPEDRADIIAYLKSVSP